MENGNIETKSESGKIRELYGEMLIDIVPNELVHKLLNGELPKPDGIPERWIVDIKGIRALKLGTVVSFGWALDDTNNSVFFRQIKVPGFSFYEHNASITGGFWNHIHEITYQDCLNKESILLFPELEGDPLSCNTQERHDFVNSMFQMMAEELNNRNTRSITGKQILEFDKRLFYTVFYGNNVLNNAYCSCIIVSKKDPLLIREGINGLLDPTLDSV